MTRTESTVTLPPIPAKRYFTIGEVSELCGVKPHVLRYWEQEFTQLKPVKRRGNRRYYQHHEVLLIRRIRSLLYEQGFTISGARNRLGDARDMPHDQDAAVRLSGAEMQGLRNELANVSTMLADALGLPANAAASVNTASSSNVGTAV
ncbi:MerR family transcriptional regulator [Achromobacter spanius]|uniref:MerR family transcriptional regulator n=1 Tax=Achromobacter spanius TaxID=217203 RepID=UPI0036DFA4F8